MTEEINITDAPLSQKWRLTASKLQPLDLAYLQKSLSAIAGQFSGDRVKSFRWGSQTYADSEGNIVYDVNEVLDMPSPVAEDQVDMMVGKVVHEAGHTKVLSSQTRTLALKDEGQGTPLSYQMLLALGEEVYTDNYVRRHMGPVASEYLRRARAQSIDLGGAEPEGVNNMLLAKHVYHVVIRPEKIEELPELERLIYHIVDGFLPKLTTERSQYERRDMYVTLWSAISKLISAKVQQKQVAQDMADDLFGFPQEGNRKSRAEKTKENVEKAQEMLGLNTPENSQGPISSGMIAHTKPNEVRLEELRKQHADSNFGRGRNSKKNKELRERLRYEMEEIMRENARHDVSPEGMRTGDMLRSIQEAVENESEDMSYAIMQYQMEEMGRTTPMNVVYNRRPIKAEEYSEFDVALYKKLMWLRDLKNTLGKETLRGELSGQVDRHHLYRAGIDHKVFKQNRVKPRRDKKVVCLLDASSSMGGNTKIYQAAHALARVVDGTEVLSYNQPGDNTCVITRQTSGRGFKRIKVNGGTPSGQALVATAMKFPDRMIVHFTDGDSNDGFTTLTALRIMQKKFPKIHVIDVQMRPRAYNRSTEGLPSNVTRVNIEGVSEFPEVLQEAIKPWVRGGG